MWQLYSVSSTESRHIPPITFTPGGRGSELSMSTKAKTEALYTALEQALGAEATETLMEILSRKDDTATGADLALLRSEVADEFQKIGARFEWIDARFEKIDARFEDLNATFHSYARMFVVVHTTTVLAVAAMVLGVTQLM